MAAVLEDRWLPHGHVLSDNLRIGLLWSGGNDWQIYEEADGGAYRILVARSSLSDAWYSSSLLEPSDLARITFGPDEYHMVVSPMHKLLCPMAQANSKIVNIQAVIRTQVDMLGFAKSLRESRELVPGDTYFHDAIYVEALCRLLPTWTSESPLTDDIVLGKWLTCGVEISVSKEFKKVVSLMPWTDAKQLIAVINESGLDMPSSSDKSVQDPRKPQNEEANLETSAEASLLDGTPFILPGRPQLEAFFNENIIDIVRNPEKYRVLGIGFPDPVILHGPPGCGKTHAVEQLVDFMGWPCYTIDSGSIGSPYIHDTSRKISGVFDQAMKNAPSILVIDEMEAYMSNRETSMDSGMHRVEEVAEFLRRIPEAAKHDVLVIGMTNMIDNIDPAIQRRGRFSHVIEVSMPGKDEVRSLLDALLASVPVADGLELEPLIEGLVGKPLSDVAFVVKQAAFRAAQSDLEAIDQVCLESAMKGLPDNQADKKRPIGFVWERKDNE